MRNREFRCVKDLKAWRPRITPLFRLLLFAQSLWHRTWTNFLSNTVKGISRFNSASIIFLCCTLCRTVITRSRGCCIGLPPITSHPRHAILCSWWLCAYGLTSRLVCRLCLSNASSSGISTVIESKISATWSCFLAGRASFVPAQDGANLAMLARPMSFVTSAYFWTRRGNLRCFLHTGDSASSSA
jgi:hypothetical protein